MRVVLWTTIPALLLGAAAPAAAQVNARVHIDVGRPGQVVYGAPRGALAIGEYDPALYGSWEDYYDDWQPETVYLYNGYYYNYPIVEYATPVVVYRYHDRFFFPPRARSFTSWRQEWRPEGYRSVYRERPQPVYRPAPVYDRGGRYDGRGDRYDGRGEQYRPAPRPDPRGGSNGSWHGNTGEDHGRGPSGGGSHGNSGDRGGAGGHSNGHGSRPGR